MGDEVYIGKIYNDNSIVELLKLYTDKNNIFQIEVLQGSDIAYRFLGECSELLDILKNGIVGMKIRMIGNSLIDNGYLEVGCKVRWASGG